ncbi:Pvc16 family protein [Novosphingobium lentum]|uniref:Pvc16 family protein n=1 Tax=Novosphingobium lentum TaxID=145287 RepID=UPI000829D5A1|nr:Pvc16 family protein [Novosphingobium lentum]
MAWSTPDITSITDVLHDKIDAAVQAAVGGAFTVNVSRSSPETSRKQPCQLSFYLMHVARDPSWRNTPVAGPRPQLNKAQPLSLNLYYLLSAWADARYDQEQRAMSAALQYIHSNPIYRHLTAGAVDEEFTISVEADTIEEMSRLWQAFTVPMRLSCVVKVGVVFIAPVAPRPTVSRPPASANIAVGPLPNAGDPIALYAAMNLAFAPFPAAADPSVEQVSGGELVAVASGPGANSNVVVRGAGLDRADAAQVFLSTPNGASEWRLGVGWRKPVTDAGLLELVLPASYLAAAPANGAVLTQLPPPGMYRLSVGRNPPPAGKPRSNRIPLAISARLDNVTGPANGPYTLHGAGFAPGSTRVVLGGVDITASATITPTTIAFPHPAAPPPGTYAPEVTVNGVPCVPGPVVTV